LSPSRLYFDLAGAASFLHCHFSDVSYYIKEDLLRLAFKSDHADAILLNDSLPKQAIDAINWVEAEFPSMRLSSSEAQETEGASDPWVYFKWSAVERHVPAVYPFGIWELEDLQGNPVSLWVIDEDELELTFEWFTDEEAKHWPAGCFLTLEELERFAGKSSSDSSLPFAMPKKADEVAEAIVTFGNRFFSEVGHVPTSKELQGYMMETGGRDLQMSYDTRGRDYFFGDKPISKRAFNDRYKSYLFEN